MRVNVVTFCKDSNGKNQWMTVEDHYDSVADARTAIDEYFDDWKRGGDWFPVSVWPRQCRRGKAWRTRRIAHESGKTLTCTIITRLRPRGEERHWAELSE